QAFNVDCGWALNITGHRRPAQNDGATLISRSNARIAQAFPVKMTGHVLAYFWPYMDFGLISSWPRQHTKFFFRFFLIFLKIFFVGLPTSNFRSLGKVAGL